MSAGCPNCGLNVLAIQQELARLKQDRENLKEQLAGLTRTVGNQDRELAEYMGTISDLRVRLAKLLAQKGDGDGD